MLRYVSDMRCRMLLPQNEGTRSSGRDINHNFKRSIIDLCTAPVSAADLIAEWAATGQVDTTAIIDWILCVNSNARRGQLRIET